MKLWSLPFLILSFFFTSTSYGSNLKFEGNLSTGVLNGTVWERVYSPETDGRKLSELRWELKDIPILKGYFQATYKEKLSIMIEGWTAIKKGDGIMTDRDWLRTSDANYWTHFSESDIDVKKGVMLDFNLAYNFYTLKNYLPNTKLTALIGYRYISWSFEDHLKYLIYSSNPNGGGLRDSFNLGNGRRAIDYTQWYTIPYLGINLELPFPSWELTTTLKYSPCTTGKDEDYHILRNLRFEEKGTGGTYFSAAIQANLPLYNNWSATIGLDYEKVKEMRADTTFSGLYFPDGASVAYDSHLITVGIKKTF